MDVQEQLLIWWCNMISTHKPLDAVYDSALRFITGDDFRSIVVYCRRDGWQSLTVRRKPHCILFIYKALLGKLHSCLRNYKSCSHCTRFQDYLVLENRHVNTEIVKLALKYYAPQKWNSLQKLVKLDKLTPFNLKLFWWTKSSVCLLCNLYLSCTSIASYVF